MMRHRKIMHAAGSVGWISRRRRHDQKQQRTPAIYHNLRFPWVWELRLSTVGVLSLAGVGMALTRSTSSTKDRILSVTCIHTPMDIFDNPHTRFRLLLSGIF